MHILIISDAYPPMRTSCATQIYDLAQAFLELDHQVSIIIPTHSQKKSVEISNTDGPTVYSVRCFKTKDVGYARRTIAEFINPFIIGFHLKRNSSFTAQKIHGITWYSPTIFWGPLVKQLKRLFNCKAYLILRDIFPDWANDLGLIKSNFIFYVFKRIAILQYQQANLIGIQSPNNSEYLIRKYGINPLKIEVLWNWLSDIKSRPTSIHICKSKLANKTIFIYAGNLGKAQGCDSIFQLLMGCQSISNIGFVFVGRGSEKQWLERSVNKAGIANCLFFDEIDHKEIPSLFEQCHVGIFALDRRHQTQNIPGKFLDYLRSGMPVIGFINPGNDLIELFKTHKLGLLFEDNKLSKEELAQKISEFLLHVRDPSFRKNNKNTFNLYFNSEVAARQILNFFKN